MWCQKSSIGRVISCYSYKQREGEYPAVYLAELCKLATTCNWTEAQLTENLQDKFVMGLGINACYSNC